MRFGIHPTNCIQRQFEIGFAMVRWSVMGLGFEDGGVYGRYLFGRWWNWSGRKRESRVDDSRGSLT